MAAFESALPESLVRNLKAEPKKAVALVVLVLVLAGMWAKIFLFAQPNQTSAGALVSDRGRAGTSGNLNPTMSTANRGLVKWTQEPITGTKRNLFAIKLDYFPVDGSRPIITADDGDGFWEQLAKSLAAKADQEKVKGILL